ncbi:MAG: FAD-dependent oxidoreductase [Brevibacillus sp.]|nr:FAD-dependent oxidoreductase [Brevibacillus sp.]
MRKAAKETDAVERKRLLTVAVSGAGITGIETSAELAQAMHQEAAALNIDPVDVRVFLVNAQERLFQEGPAKVGRKLERLLNNYGVTVLHRCKALHEKDRRSWPSAS